MTLSSSNRLSAIFGYSPITPMPDIPHSPGSKPMTVVDPEQYVGIEIEVEGIDFGLDSFYEMFFTGTDIRVSNFWEVDTDGSLKNNGKEFISAPLKGTQIEAALTALQQYLQGAQPKHSFMYRCGTHFHFDCRYMTIEHLLKFLICYMLVEEVFYDTAGEDRKASNFCVPLSYSKFNLAFPEFFQLYLKGDYEKAVTRLTSSWKKYTGLNLSPLKTLGTIEFRHYAGTCDPKFLITQINLIQNIFKYSASITLPELQRIANSLNVNSGYSYFCNQVLGTDLLVPGEKLKSMLENNVAFVRDLFSFLDYCRANSSNFKGSFLQKKMGVIVKDYEQLVKENKKRIELWESQEGRDNFIDSFIVKKVAGSKNSLDKLLRKRKADPNQVLEFK